MPAAAHDYVVPPALETPKHIDFALKGIVNDRLQADIRNWLLVAPNANPAMLQMFRDRDRLPARALVPWAGEFAGKYLISAVQALRLTQDRELKASLKSFVRDLIATQGKDGYLGPFPTAENMVGPGRWDLWGQYHVMLGLFLYYKETGDRSALAACRRAADRFCREFLDGVKRVVQAGSEEMNESSIHIFTLLYGETGEPRYLKLAHEIEKDWETPPSGDYVRTALAGIPYYKTPKPRWEGLHAVQAIAELYFLAGDEKYKQAYIHLWQSIREGDRHNTGGFSSGEQATGNPYDPRPIETCCTIAWMAITRDYLRLTGDSRAADELELSMMNAVFGAQHPSGRWWTYNTPMDGERKASAHEIVFQARAGSPELNCCSVNGPRGIGILSEWALMKSDDGLVLNYYGPSRMATELPSGVRVRLEQETDYPVGGKIRLKVSPQKAARFTLSLRIPGWSRRTRVTVNGKSQPGAAAGTYLALERNWKAGDVVDIDLDMSPRLWVGEREAAGKVSVYHGPLLLAYDPRFDVYEPAHLPALSLTAFPPARLETRKANGPAPLLLLRFATDDGKGITLCDFASAGAAGNPYVSWLPARAPQPIGYSSENPLRVYRP